MCSLSNIPPIDIYVVCNLFTDNRDVCVSGENRSEFKRMKFNKQLIMGLVGRTDDAKDLIEWLETGAFDALERK